MTQHDSNQEKTANSDAGITRRVGLLQRLSREDDLAEFERVMADLEKVVTNKVAPEKKEAALEHIVLLEAAISNPEPDIQKMIMVKKWFRENCPTLVEAVVSVITHPVVGRVVEDASYTLANELRRRFS